MKDVNLYLFQENEKKNEWQAMPSKPTGRILLSFPCILVSRKISQCTSWDALTLLHDYTKI
jgi:hypothetical protein